MKVFEELGDNIVAVGVLVIIIVVIAILLINLKTTPNVACSSLYTYNASANDCYLTTNASVTTAVNSLGTNIDTAVTAIQTPVSYVTIIVLVVVFGAIIYYIVHKMRGAQGE